MKPLRFEPLTPRQQDQALALMRAYYVEDGHRFEPETAQRALDAILAGDAPAWFWLIALDGAVVGYLCLTGGFSLEVGAGDFFLDEIYVVPDVRSAGIGRAAVAFAEAEARAKGAARLCLEVQPENARAAALYVREGYESHGRPLMSKRL